MSLKPLNQRQLRVGEELRHALVRILAKGGLDDPVLAGVNITVTEVRISPDLKNATVFVTPLGGANLDETVRGLNRAAGYFRGRLSREVVLRNTPRVDFRADRSFGEAAQLRQVMETPRVRRDLERQAGPEGPEDEVENGA